MAWIARLQGSSLQQTGIEAKAVIPHHERGVRFRPKHARYNSEPLRPWSDRSGMPAAVPLC